MKYSEIYLNYIKYLLEHKRRKISRKEFKNVLDDEGLDVSRTTKIIERESINGYFIDGIEMKGDRQEELIKEEEVNEMCSCCGDVKAIKNREDYSGKKYCKECWNAIDNQK